MTTVLETITSTAVPGTPNPTWGQPHNAWKVTLKNSRGQRMTVPFYMGVGIPYGAPSTVEVMEVIISDALSYRNSRDFDDFVSEFGYEIHGTADYRAALKTYNACKRMSTRLEKFLTDEEFEALAYPEEA